MTTFGDHAVHLISGFTGSETILRACMIDPQGIICDNDGNLVVTDSGNHQLLKLVVD